MTKDNEDALRCAEILDSDVCDLHDPTQSAAHLRRLVAENEALRADVDHKDAFATQLGRDLMTAQREIEAKDALLRQMVVAHEADDGIAMSNAVEAIIKHLEGRA